MTAEKESKRPNSKSGNTTLPSETRVGAVVKGVILNLRAGNLEKAADLFLAAQGNKVLPSNRDLVKKLLEILGVKTANQLIDAFAFHPCQFCTKGRTKCEICRGKGYITENAICENCFGLGIARCSFCNGSSWLALADIPKGIRVHAFIRRAEKTLKDAKLVLNAAVPQPSKDNPASSLKKCAALWVAVDKLIGVLENIVVTFQSSMVPSSELDRKLHDIVQQAVRAGAKLEKRIREIVAAMQASARLEARSASPGSGHAELAKTRAEFYRSLLDKSNVFSDLSDTHQILANAINKRLGGKPLDKK